MSQAAQSLLLEYLRPSRDASILLLEGGPGWLAQEVANYIPDGRVLTLARDIREVQSAQKRLAGISNFTASQDVFPPSDGWDFVLLTIPKERRYSRTLLLAAWEALKPGGQLLLAGPTKGGAKAVIKDAERLFGNASVLGYRSHQRVASCTRGEILPNPLPKEFQQIGIAPGTRHSFSVKRPEGKLALTTHPGIFSWESLDEGTALLLKHLVVEPGAQVWDVGCGCGVIGLSVAHSGADYVWMSDINLIAVNYAQRNAVSNKLDQNILVFPSDALTPPTSMPSSPRFDLIISNPAFHQGRGVNKSMADRLITRAQDFLTPSGRLVIVANRFLNYDKYMRDHFKHVSRTAETSKYHLLEAHN